MRQGGSRVFWSTPRIGRWSEAWWWRTPTPSTAEAWCSLSCTTWPGRAVAGGSSTLRFNFRGVGGSDGALQRLRRIPRRPIGVRLSRRPARRLGDLLGRVQLRSGHVGVGRDRGHAGHGSCPGGVPGQLGRDDAVVLRSSWSPQRADLGRVRRTRRYCSSGGGGRRSCAARAPTRG